MAIEKDWEKIEVRMLIDTYILWIIYELIMKNNYLW